MITRYLKQLRQLAIYISEYSLECPRKAKAIGLKRNVRNAELIWSGRKEDVLNKSLRDI